MAAQTLSKHGLFDRIESGIAWMIDILKNRPRFPTLAPKPIPTTTPPPPISATEPPVPTTAPPSLSTASATPPQISPQPPYVLHTNVLHVILRPAQHKARFNCINKHLSNQNDILPTLVNAPTKPISIPTSPTPSRNPISKLDLLLFPRNLKDEEPNATGRREWRPPWRFTPTGQNAVGRIEWRPPWKNHYVLEGKNVFKGAGMICATN
ncbi:hypothetical protein Hanom_Chr11g00973321 [Helianthus anomalus]